MRILTILMLLGWTASAQSREPIDVEYFEKKVRPILSAHCQSCHDAKKQKGGLTLTSRAAALKGGDTGPAIVPTEAKKSLLIEAVRYDADLRMPPKGKLSDAEIATLTAWVAGGAPWPESTGTEVATGLKPMDVKAVAKGHWAYEPVKRPTIPANTPAIDYLLTKSLQEKGLRYALPAERAKLIRRISYDVTGQPPTPEEIDAFVNDKSADAYPKLIDRLLASPQYGERWARHWLDLVRFAETHGHEFDFEIANAWRYRDYVIRTFNKNLHIDQFIREHIAGDLLPKPRRDANGLNESIQATGFWFLGEAKHSPVDIRQDQADRIDNQIDVFGKAFLGQTVACARCHDHKFDAISQRDYYALFGVITSSRYQQAYLADPAEQKKLIDELASLRKPKETPPAKSEGEAFESFDDGWRSRWKAFGPAFTLDGPPHTGRLSKSLTGVLQSPSFVVPSERILVKIAGEKARIRLIIDNFQLIQNPIYGGLEKGVNHGEQYRWVALDVARWQGHHAYLEIHDDGAGFFAVREVRFNSEPGKSPKLDIAEPMPTVQEKATVDRIHEIEQKLQRMQALAPAMADGNGFNEHVFIRGNPKTLGDEVPRRFLELFSEKPTKKGSGRAELAAALTDPRNPLVARVFVNRIWHHHFGRGIVASTDDFGRQGQPPTHPELLDYLASEFVRSGWDLKQLHREILLSQAYQQGSEPHPSCADKVATADPRNQLLHQYPVRRLEAEAIRDAILAVSGRLDRTVGGPSVMPHLTEHMNGRGRPGTSGPLDGNGRRSIYLQVRRNFLEPMLVAFDFPTPFTAIGRRGNSNVPAQALVMMNNPFVLQQAERWSQRIATEIADPAKRIERMYREAYGRRPTDAEQSDLREFVSERTKEVGGLKAWQELAHVLFNTKSFIYYD